MVVAEDNPPNKDLVVAALAVTAAAVPVPPNIDPAVEAAVPKERAGAGLAVGAAAVPPNREVVPGVAEGAVAGLYDRLPKRDGVLVAAVGAAAGVAAPPKRLGLAVAAPPPE